MTEEVSDSPHLRIAKRLYQDLLLSAYKEDALPKGSGHIVIALNSELPEHTPRDFVPSNDLEEFLFANKQGTQLSVTAQLGATRFQFYNSLGKNTVSIEDDYDCEMVVVTGKQKSPTDAFALRLELTSKKLQRSVYIDVSSALETPAL